MFFLSRETWREWRTKLAPSRVGTAPCRLGAGSKGNVTALYRVSSIEKEERDLTDRIADPWRKRTPFEPGEEWPVRVDRFLEEGVSEENVDRWAQKAPQRLLVAS